MYVRMYTIYKSLNETSLSYTNFVSTNGDIIKCVPSIREVMKWACILQHVNISDWILCAAMATLRQVLNYVLLLYKYTNIYLYVLMQSSTDAKYDFFRYFTKLLRYLCFCKHLKTFEWYVQYYRLKMIDFIFLTSLNLPLKHFCKHFHKTSPFTFTQALKRFEQ